MTTTEHAFNEVSVDYLRELFEANFVTAELIWRVRPREHFRSERSWKVWNSTFAGKVAGTTRKDGCRDLKIDGRSYLAHRVIWALDKGAWPLGELDHVRRDADNRANGIRGATRGQNNRNRGRQANNTSGEKGVSWNVERGKWRASIQQNGKKIHLGYFDDIEKAAAAYRKAALELQGEFAPIEVRDPPSPIKDNNTRLLVAAHPGETPTKRLSGSN